MLLYKTLSRRHEQFIQAGDLLLQHALSVLAEFVHLAVARIAFRVGIVQAHDPAQFEQALERAVQCASAKNYAVLAQNLHIFHDGISVLRLRRETQQDEIGGFGEWGFSGLIHWVVLSDMSSGYMLIDDIIIQLEAFDKAFASSCRLHKWVIALPAQLEARMQSFQHISAQSM